MQLITIIKKHDRLVPGSDESFDLFNSLDLDQEISFEYKEKKQRSLGYHKLYWAMITAVLRNQAHYKTKENLHEAVKVRAGHYETIIPFKGDPFLIPKSISFDKMDSLQFDFFMREAKTVCVELVGDEALDEILRFM